MVHKEYSNSISALRLLAQTQFWLVFKRCPVCTLASKDISVCIKFKFKTHTSTQSENSTVNSQLSSISSYMNMQVALKKSSI
jgi:hypothetical protein